MGYTTKFVGQVNLSRKLTLQEAKQLLEFSEDPKLIQEGQKPNSYMQWVPNESMDAIVWDQQEKFYDYEEWMVWLMGWLAARDITCNGQLDWRGESSDDIGRIYVVDNKVSSARGQGIKPSNSKPLTLDRLARMALDAATN